MRQQIIALILYIPIFLYFLFPVFLASCFLYFLLLASSKYLQSKTGCDTLPTDTAAPSPFLTEEGGQHG